MFKKFHRNETAATIAEYALILVLIVGACITVLQLVGNEAGGFWNGNTEAVDTAFTETADNLGAGRLGGGGSSSGGGGAPLPPPAE